MAKILEFGTIIGSRTVPPWT